MSLRLSVNWTWAHGPDGQYSTNYKRGKDNIKQKSSFTGNNMKSLHNSVEDSLKKFKTDYLDILYVHWVSMPET